MSANEFAKRLCAAARRGDAERVVALLRISQPNGRRPANFYHPLAEAAMRGHYKCVELLIPSSDQEARNDALVTAVCKGNVECVKLLLPVSSPLPANLQGMTAPMFAALYGRAECLELLLPPIDPKASDHQGMTLLMWSVRDPEFSADPSCTRLLLPLSDAKAVDEDGMTALMHAAMYGALNCVELLMPWSEVGSANREGQTAEQLAKARGHARVAAMIGAYSAAQEEKIILSQTTAQAARSPSRRATL